MAFEQIVRDAARGDQRAWVMLFKRLSPKLIGFFAARRPGYDYRDLVQETMLIVCMKLPDFEFRSEAAFIAWVYRIAHFSALMAHRQWERTAKSARALGLVERPPSRKGSSLLVRLERLERTLGEIERLPSAQRRAIENLLAGGTAKELAERLGIAWVTVRVLESQAMARLRQALQTPTPSS